MRTFIVQRIKELRDSSVHNVYVLKDKRYKDQPYYMGDDAWEKLQDEDLVKVFEQVVRRAYTQR